MDEMYARLCETVTSEYARQLFVRLYEQCIGIYGEVTESVYHILQDIAILEEIKEGYKRDIRERGVTELYKNGKQQFTRENKSVTMAANVSDKQRRLLHELRLTPASARAVTVDDEDDGDAFEDFQ